MVPEIRSMTDIIFCHSGLFFPLLPPPKDPENVKNNWRYYHFTNINNSHMNYGTSDMECNGQIFLSFWTILCPLNPLTTRKIQIWKNEKNTLIYHFTNVYYKWQSYDVWFLRYGVYDGQNFLTFWTVFCPFTTLTTWKIKI